MSADTANDTKQPKKQITDSQKEAMLIFQQMQALYDANDLRIGSKVLEKPKPYEWDSKDKTTGEVKHNISHKLVFGFTGGTIREKVTQEMYDSAKIGDKFLLEGYIKSTGETKTFSGENGSSQENAVITLNPAITKITPLDLTTFADLAV